MSDVMKVPWLNPVVFYIYENGQYRLDCVKNILTVREMMLAFNIQTQKAMSDLNCNLIKKLETYPCLILQRETMCRIFDTNVEKIHNTIDDFVWDRGVLVEDDDYFFINYNTFVTVYHQNSHNQFKLNATFDIFCNTMMIPCVINDTTISQFQAKRKRYVEKQVQASRIILGLDTVSYYYDAFYMSHIKTIYSYRTCTF